MEEEDEQKNVLRQFEIQTEEYIDVLSTMYRVLSNWYYCHPDLLAVFKRPVQIFRTDPTKRNALFLLSVSERGTIFYDMKKPFLSKMVYKRIRVWTSDTLPVWNFLKYNPQPYPPSPFSAPGQAGLGARICRLDLSGPTLDQSANRTCFFTSKYTYESCSDSVEQIGLYSVSPHFVRV